MSHILYDESLAHRPTAASASEPRRGALQPSIARAVLAAAVVLGATADALLRESLPGLGLALWIALVGLNTVALLWRAGLSISREAVLWLASALLFASATAWRNAEILVGFDVMATVACLAMAAVSTRDPGAALFARRLRDTFFTAVDVVAGVALGILPLAFREALLAVPGHNALSRVRTIVRPAIIAGVALLVFGSLLRGADPIFASLVSFPAVNLEVAASHVVIAGFFTWIVAGWARAALATGVTPHRAAPTLPVQLDGADITAALGTLIVLFAAFIATQLGWFFGGERFLQARTGLTAATYARQGFFQMVWVVTLVVPVLVATRAALRPDAALARRHTLLSLPVIVLLGAIIVSAMLRMKMYVHYYGLTTDRLYPMVFMLWLGAVIVWLGITVLRGWGRPFVAGAVLSGLATLGALNVADPDAIVARVNIARAANVAPGPEATLDLVHLATLHGGGVALATKAVARTAASANPSDAGARCTAARVLLQQWGPDSRLRQRLEKKGAWRYWNRDDGVALEIVGKHRDALVAASKVGCAPPTTSGNSQT